MPNNAGRLHIGVDVGTSSCRVCAIGNDGRELAFAATALPPPARSGGRIEQAPDLWWGAVERSLDTVLGRIAPRRVSSLAVDATSGTLLLADGAGTPLAPALMYNDQSSTAEAAHVGARAPADSPAQGASSALCKLLQLLGRHPFRAGMRALHQADWIAGRLRGRHGTSDENNALKLGYDPVTRAWPAWISGLGIDPAVLPDVVPAGTPTGRVSPEMAARFGFGDDVAVVAGTTDSIAAAVAAGIASPGDAVTSLGSTLVLKVVATRPIASAAHGVYTHRLGDLWLAGGASNSGGAVLASYFDADTLERLSATLDTGRASDLDYYPLPAPGERFPTNDPHLQPRLSPRPREDRDFLHGLLESLARIERDGYRLLETLGAPYPAHIATAGGGAGNDAWRRIRERVLGVPVTRAQRSEAAYGAALLAARAWR